MSEYIEVQPESTEDPNKMIVRTNLVLREFSNLEDYPTVEAMEEGSALAQMIAPIDGLRRLRIERNDLIIWREEEMPWHLILSEVTIALKEFFL
jgi:hypothetical protein